MSKPICNVDGCLNVVKNHHKGIDGSMLYRQICSSHHNKKYNCYKTKKVGYRAHKGNVCFSCGFVPVNSCQLDVDHIDGNHKNDNTDNLQTLCANCHRLKTYLNRDWE